MKNITKKDFIAKLQTSRNVLITSGSSRSDKKEQIKKYLLSFYNFEFSEFRTVKKTQSNGIQFSNESWIYFDTVGKHYYYSLDSFLIAETVNDGYYSYVVYYVKPL